MSDAIEVSVSRNTDTKPPLKDPATYYRCESAVGAAYMDQIAKGLAEKNPSDQKNTEIWARANPMLAMREYQHYVDEGELPSLSGQPTDSSAFHRYFKTPQYDRWFGAGSRTASDAPKSLADALTLLGVHAPPPTTSAHSVAPPLPNMTKKRPGSVSALRVLSSNHGEEHGHSLVRVVEERRKSPSHHRSNKLGVHFW